MKMGDLVVIHKDSDFYGTSIRNPTNTIGAVTEYENRDMGVIVTWPGSGRTNSYSPKDLVCLSGEVT